jgi:hypothetical protein
MSREAALLQGINGGHVINAGESTVTGNFRWIQMIEDTVFTDITDATLENVADLESPITHLAGTGFGGNITSITVSSGTCIAYNV